MSKETSKEMSKEMSFEEYKQAVWKECLKFPFTTSHLENMQKTFSEEIERLYSSVCSLFVFPFSLL